MSKNPREKQNYTTFEIKESFYTGAALAKPRHFPWDSDYMFGIRYSASLPSTRMDANVAYSLAIQAHYYEWCWEDKEWESIGGPGEFLCRLAEIGCCEFSWPDPYPNCRSFKQAEYYDVYPWRELMRRHLHQKLYLSDRDLIWPIGYTTK